jgi:hypothetical protein
MKSRTMSRTMLRKLIPAAAILSLVAGPAAAQMMPAISPFKAQEKKLTPEEIEAQKQRERDYKAAMQKIPDKKVASDPWGGIREAPQASTSTTAKTKPQ